MELIKSRQSPKWARKNHKFKLLLLVPFVYAYFLLCCLQLPLEFSGIVENYFAQVKMARETILLFIGRTYQIFAEPSIEIEKLKLNIKQKHRYIIEAERKRLFQEVVVICLISPMCGKY